MLRNALFVARHDLRQSLRQKETLAWVVVMPVVFFYFIGTVTGGFAPGGPRPDPLLLVAPDGAGWMADELAERLAARGFELERAAAEPALEDGTARRRILLPTSLTAGALAGEAQALELVDAGEGPRGEHARFRALRATYTLLADLVALAADGREPTPEALAGLEAMPRTLSVAARPAGARQEIPTGFEQTIPGTLVMFTLIVLLTSGVVLLVIERKQGLLRRLASAPLTRGEVVLGKWLGMMGLGVAQVAIAVLLGTLLFRMDWGPHPLAVGGVLLAWAGLVASIALLAAGLVRSEAQAIAIGVLAANVLAALGGCWWPIEVTPPWMQRLALFLPTGWTMDALHELISFQAPAASVVPHVAGMALATLLVGAGAARVFRFR